MSDIKVINCSTGYSPNNIIFRDMNYQFKQGLYIVDGPNGSGKSTLFRTLAGILKPLTGCILLRDCNVYINAGSRSEISYLPHRLGGQGSLKVKYYLRFWASLRSSKSSQKDCRRIESLFGLNDLANSKLETLSRGQMQRIALIKTLSSPSSVLILDEPFSGLDMQYTNELTGELIERSKANIVIISLHGPHAIRNTNHIAIDIASFRNDTKLQA